MKNLEIFLAKYFSDFVFQTLAKENMIVAQNIEDKFEETYTKLSSKKAPVEQIVAELKKIGLSSAGLPAPTKDDSTMVTVSSPGDSYYKTSKSEPHVHIEKPCPIIVSRDLQVDVKELDSPASKFLPQGPVVQKVPFKVTPINQLFPILTVGNPQLGTSLKVSLKDKMNFLKQQATYDLDRSKDRCFFFLVDNNFDLNDGQPSKSYNNSPAKSARSTTSKRRRRASQLGSTLQKELMNLKRPNIRPVKTFDDDIMRSLKPVFIFDDEFLDNIFKVLNSLVLKKKEKRTFKEMVFFMPEEFTYSLREFENHPYNDKLLNFVRTKIKEYEEIWREKRHIRLCFEDIVLFLGKLGVLNDRFVKQISNMFKYDNEDIIGIYETFILTKDFQDFCETLFVFQNSKYFEKNQKAKIELIQGEKTFNLLNSIQTYVEEFIMIYYDKYSRQLLTKMINEANEDLIKFANQYQCLTEKASQELTGYINFNVHLGQFLEKNLKQKYMRKMSIRTETLFAQVSLPERSVEAKQEMEKLVKSEDYKVTSHKQNCSLYNPLFIKCINQAYDVTHDAEDFIENFTIFMEYNSSRKP